LLAKGGYTPRFSPDGKWVAFTGTASDEIGHVFTVPAGGGVPEQLDYGTANAQCPAWSPDGSEVVFAGQDASGRNYDLWRAKTAGPRSQPAHPLGIERQLQAQNLPAISLCPQDWIPGRLLFGARQRDTSFLFEVEMGASGTAGQIRVVPSAIGATGARIVRGSSRRLTILFAPERRRTNIWGCNPAGSMPLQQLTHDDTLRPGFYGTWPALSGDGNVLGFITERTGSPDICLKDLRTGAEQLLGASPSLQSPLFLDHTAGRVVFVREQGSKTSVILRSVAEKRDRVLTADCPVLHDWSSDGEFLLCSRGNNLFQFRTGESRKTPLLYLAQPPLMARFSPDRHWVSYVIAGREGENVEGFLTPLDGSSRTIHICQEVWNLSLDWAPDGNAVYYWSTRDGFRCLYKQPLDPENKAPQGPPVAILHRHGVQSYPWSGGTLAVSSDRLAMTLVDELANIWKIDLPE
jgi:Tol biopolymer transport system component